MTRLTLALGIFCSALGFGLACSNDGATGRDDGTGNVGTGGGQNPPGGGGRNTGIAGNDTITVPGSQLLANCGNSAHDKDEECDDGNKEKGDGCSTICQKEADWSCPEVGPCRLGAVCGDGVLARSETCDDMNTMAGDGCSADCQTVEKGYQCRVPGKRCVPLCGDGEIVGTENCDDGEPPENDDGCSVTCLTEPGWSCTGTTCVQSVCGNGMKETGESCDAGASNGLFFGDGTGCSKTCTKEPECREGGKTVACKTPCGDGSIDPGEQCDDGNAVSGDGCSATCMNESGFTCMPKVKKDAVPCTNGVGDCLQLPITYRDFDGQNATGGHPDFFFYGATAGGAKVTCVPNASGANLVTPANQNATCPPTDATNPCRGIAAATLGPDGKPTLGTTTTCACTFTDWDETGMLAGLGRQCSSGGAAQPRTLSQMVKVVQSADTFEQWYTDSATSTKVIGTLELAQLQNGTQYRFTSSGGRTVYDDIHDIWLTNRQMPPVGGVTSLSSGFFPLEMQAATAKGATKLCNLWNYWNPAPGCVARDANPAMTARSQWDPRGWNSGGAAPAAGEALGVFVSPVTGMPRNFYFTSEVRYLFRFVGGEELSFFGDDDVFVFINGHLVLDLGAPHERMRGAVTLSADGASASWQVSVQNVATNMDTVLPGAQGMGTVTGLGLEKDKTYEIAIFHADRHPRESNYELTLSGFSTNVTECRPTCGDGVVTGGEECDDGPNNKDGVYGGCSTQCTYGPFCGDGMVTEGQEECDQGKENGLNAEYNGMGCKQSCQRPARCGDARTDAQLGEACDEGPDNSDEPGAPCSRQCQLSLR